MYYSKLAAVVLFSSFCLASEEKYSPTSELKGAIIKNNSKEVSKLLKDNPDTYSSEILFEEATNAIRFIRPEAMDALFVSPEFEVDIEMQHAYEGKDNVLGVFCNFLRLFRCEDKKKGKYYLRYSTKELITL